MKKLPILLLIILCGCTKKIDTYFPFYKNKIYIYCCDGAINDCQMYPMYMSANKFQRRSDTGTKIFTQVFQKENGQLKYSNIFTSDLENQINTNQDDSYILFQKPLKVGKSWSQKNGHNSKITNMNKKIETLYATFDNAMEITTEIPNIEIKKDYYVPNIGFVKSIVEFLPENLDTQEIQLLKIIDNASLKFEKKIYIVDKNENKLVQLPFVIDFKTNDNIIEKILIELKKYDLVAQNSKINMLEFDKNNLDNQILFVDFSKDFLSSSKEFESLSVQAIINTLGNIYEASKIKLTIDGENYKNGEYLNVE